LQAAGILRVSNTELLAMANKAQIEVLSVTLRGITDDARRAMMLESAGVQETEEGGMIVSSIFKYEQPHLVAAEAVANSIGWMENAGYVVIKDPSLEDVDEQ
jgi:hypothetical protein